MLDGKYEITSQRELSPRETLFGATAPDGTALHIRWYDLRGAEDERAFERYRTLLRQLRREGHAAVYDLVARPGAHYVVWRVPGEADAVPVAGTSAGLGVIEALLATHDRTLSDAYICAQPDAPPQVYALAFEGLPVLASPGAATPEEGATVTSLDKVWLTGWKALRPWTLGGVLALTGVLLLLLSSYRFVRTSLVDVPNVRGQTVNRALQTLYKAGFSTTSIALTSLRPAGEVLEVSPSAGTPLRPGRTLSVRYALPAGRAPERVPAVTGTGLEDAEAALTEAGFRVGIARSYSGSRAGTVIAQTPTAQTLAAQGSRVGLLVSDGPRGTLTFLPELTGLPLEDALSLAEAAGFARESVRLERMPGNGVTAGTVLAQNVAPFLSVAEGRAQLRLTVARRSGPVTGESGTPDLTGLSLAEAQKRARATGLSVSVAERVSAPELPEGVVLQHPAPGTPLQGSVTVTLNGPDAPPLPVPRIAASVDAETKAAVRRARYAWQLGESAGGQLASITVELEGGIRQTIVQGQRVSPDERLEGTYLTTATGPLTFTLTLNGAPYGVPLTVNP